MLSINVVAGELVSRKMRYLLILEPLPLLFQRTVIFPSAPEAVTPPGGFSGTSLLQLAPVI